MMKKTSGLILFLLLLNIKSPLHAQERSNAPLEIPRIQQRPLLDGIPDEAFWDEAVSITEFRQFEPEIGRAATNRAEVLLAYDDNYLYVAARSYSEGSDVYATVMERDESQDRDDYFEIHLDTYNDRTNTLIFRTNPLGARYDYESSRNGEEFNSSWNTFWDAASRRLPDGWSTELRIPLTSLRYEPAPEQIMRFKAVFRYKNINELVLHPLNDTQRTPVVYQYNNSREIVLRNLPSSTPLYITPYLKGGVNSANRLNSSGTGYVNDTQLLERKNYLQDETADKIVSNVGLDLKWKPDPGNTFDITLNTDFAEVEADDRVINISRFPISLPEKRVFFLENADLFNSNMFEHRLFHSRRIGISSGTAVPIIGGVRITGNRGDWQYGVMSLQTHEVEEVDQPSYNMSVTRVKHSVGTRGSYIGFLNTNKLGPDHNILTALDGSIRVRENIRTRFTLATTFDEQTGDLRPFYGMSINTFRSNGFGFEYRYRDYTRDFNPELGFVGEPNTKRITLNNGWRRTYADHPSLQSISLGYYLRNFWVSSNNKQFSFQTNLYMSFNFKSGLSLGMVGPVYLKDHLYEPWEISDDITIPVGEYAMWSVSPRISSGNAEQYRISGSFDYGEFYGGSQFSVNGNLLYDFSRFFQARFGASYNRLAFPNSYSGGGSTTLSVNRYYSRMKFAFSSKTFLNTYVQYSSGSDELGWNLRFRYAPREGTDLYVVYNHSMNMDRNAFTPQKPVTVFQGITLKFSKTLVQ